MNTSGISPSFLGLSRSSGQVTHVLLTRSRLCPRPKPGSSLHLHVLGTPPAFVLSQDQTLREELLNWLPRAGQSPSARGNRLSQRVVRGAPVRLTALCGGYGQNPGPIPGGIRPLHPHAEARCTQRASGRKTGSILAPSFERPH